MSMEVLESLLQLRKLHKDLLDAFDKLNSPLEIVQKVRDVISDLPDAHAMLKLWDISPQKRVKGYPSIGSCLLKDFPWELSRIDDWWWVSFDPWLKIIIKGLAKVK